MLDLDGSVSPKATGGGRRGARKSCLALSSTGAIALALFVPVPDPRLFQPFLNEGPGGAVAVVREPAVGAVLASESVLVAIDPIGSGAVVSDQRTIAEKAVEFPPDPLMTGIKGAFPIGEALEGFVASAVFGLHDERPVDPGGRWTG
jgi:hypothetical protein